jgi:hypothetical protein
MWEGPAVSAPFQASGGRVGQIHRSTLSTDVSFPRFALLAEDGWWGWCVPISSGHESLRTRVRELRSSSSLPIMLRRGTFLQKPKKTSL